MSLFGVSLTIAAIAVLPVLIGLAVDYAIQFQARFDEQGGDPARGGCGGGAYRRTGDCDGGVGECVGICACCCFRRCR